MELVELRGAIDNLRVRSQDLHGLRMTNAGDAINPQDYITKAQLENFVTKVVPKTFPRLSTPSTPVTIDETVMQNDIPVTY